MKKTTRFITTLSVYVALIIVMSIVPYLGYIQIGPIAITTIPVIIALASFHLKFWGALISSIFFGIFSIVHAMMYGSLFIGFPDILLIPRIILGFVIGLVVVKWKINKVYKLGILGGLVVISNTLLFTLYLYFNQWAGREAIKDTFWAWIILIYVNFLVEFGVALSVCLLVFRAFKDIVKNYEENKSIFW